MEFRMQVRGMAEAERLKTALYRFREVAGPLQARAPTLRVEAEPAGLVSVIDVDCERTAEDFRRYWARFRTEPFSFRGLHDF